jgi:hypothetical protein
MPMLRITFALLVVSAALAAAGCGGGGGSSSSGTSADEWARGLCTALTTWTSSVKSVGTSLRSNVTPTSLKSAANDISSASETLVSDLKGLGKPDTKSGQEARAAIDQLSTQVKQDVKDMRSAVSGASGAQGALAAATSVASTLSKMGSQIGSAASKADDANAGGELDKAFRNSSACKKLANSGG